jgi:hypothetical protein
MGSAGGTCARAASETRLFLVDGLLFYLRELEFGLLDTAGLQHACKAKLRLATHNRTACSDNDDRRGCRHGRPRPRQSKASTLLRRHSTLPETCAKWHRGWGCAKQYTDAGEPPPLVDNSRTTVRAMRVDAALPEHALTHRCHVSRRAWPLESGHGGTPGGRHYSHAAAPHYSQCCVQRAGRPAGRHAG